MKKIHFALVKLPVISITLFFCCCLVAALIHPGSEKEIINFKNKKLHHHENQKFQMTKIKKKIVFKKKLKN
jgi:hypothetical protein